MLTIERLTDVSGNLMAGFFVRDGAGKAVAIGASCADGFVMPTQKRYARDVDLCRKVALLTGQPIKWNLSFYGRHCSSGTRQELMAQVRRCSDPRCNHTRRLSRIGRGR
jgi:hypothetical protein